MTDHFLLSPDVVILAAGTGSRFTDAGYPTPKQLFRLQPNSDTPLLESIAHSVMSGTGVTPTVAVRKGGPLIKMMGSMNLLESFRIHQVPVLTPESSSSVFSAMSAVQQHGERPVLFVDSDSWFPPEVYRAAYQELSEHAANETSGWTCAVCPNHSSVRRSWFATADGVAVGIYGVTSSRLVASSFENWYSVPSSPEPSIPTALQTFLGHPLSSTKVPQSKWVSVGTPEELMSIEDVTATIGFTESRKEARSHRWVAVDLDDTLVQDFKGVDRSPGRIGPEFPWVPGNVVDLVRKLINNGTEVRIFTARVANPDPVEAAIERMCISEWSYRTFNVNLTVTHEKDLGCIAIIDNRAFTAMNGSTTFTAELAC